MGRCNLRLLSCFELFQKYINRIDRHRALLYTHIKMRSEKEKKISSIFVRLLSVWKISWQKISTVEWRERESKKKNIVFYIKWFSEFSFSLWNESVWMCCVPVCRHKNGYCWSRAKKRRRKRRRLRRHGNFFSKDENLYLELSEFTAGDGDYV